MRLGIVTRDRAWQSDVESWCKLLWNCRWMFWNYVQHLDRPSSPILSLQLNCVIALCLYAGKCERVRAFFHLSLQVIFINTVRLFVGECEHFGGFCAFSRKPRCCRNSYQIARSWWWRSCRPKSCASWLASAISAFGQAHWTVCPLSIFLFVSLLLFAQSYSCHVVAYKSFVDALSIAMCVKLHI